LLYAPQAQHDGKLPLPIGNTHKFAPIALGDVAKVVAHVVTGHGKHGFDDKHRGQLITLTGKSITLAVFCEMVLTFPRAYDGERR